jgi:hypothetical protein
MASDPLWIGAGKGTEVGTATIAESTDLLTIAGHGLSDGDTVTVDTLTGGGSVLTVDAVYFVRDSLTDTFGLALTPHGPLVTFAADGGADVYLWAPQYHAAELRRGDALLLYPGVADPFGARQGVRPHSQVPVSVSGTTWTVHDLTAVVYPGVTDQSGPYRVQHPEETGSLDPADGSNPRVDGLDLQIQDDDEDGSGLRRTRVVYTAGTPAGSPSAPTVAANSLRLATISVPAGGSPVPSVATLAVFTVAAGGILPVRDSTERPSAGLYDGLPLWRQDHKRIEVRDTGAGSWRGIHPGGWVPIVEDSFSGTPPFTVDLTQGGKFPAGTFSAVRVRARGSLSGSAGHVTVRINNDSTTDMHVTAFIRRDADTGATTEADRVVGTVWRVGRWGTATGASNLEFTIFNTSTSNVLSFLARSGALGTTAAVSFVFESWGNLTQSLLLSSLRFATFDAASDLDINYQIEGWIA